MGDRKVEKKNIVEFVDVYRSLPALWDLRPQQLSSNTIHFHSTCWLYKILAGTVCTMWLYICARDFALLHNLQYRLHTVQSFAHTKILYNNIDRHGTAANIICNPHCTIILNVYGPLYTETSFSCLKYLALYQIIHPCFSPPISSIVFQYRAFHLVNVSDCESNDNNRIKFYLIGKIHYWFVFIAF